jgi:uncharacterized membrane protein
MLAAQERSLLIERFEATVSVLPSSDLLVEEVIRVRFNGSWNGLYRTIPVEYRRPQGFAYRLGLRVESITDDGDTPLEYEASRERHYRKLKIWVPGAQDATRTLKIRYRVEDGLRFFEEHDELYWNVTGDEWDVPIQRASAVVVLPRGASGLRADAFTGGYGSTERAVDIEEFDQGFAFEAQRSLNFREGLTVVVGWNPGLVDRPTATDAVGDFLKANVLFVIPILAWAIMFWLWYTRGRDPQRLSVAPRYEPPHGMTPAEVGTLLDNRPDPRDIIATVVDLAVRGYLKIEEQEKTGFLKFGGPDYLFHRVKDPGEWTDLHPHEQAVLRGVFGGGSWETARLDDLKEEFYEDLPGIKTGIYDRLKSLGFYRRRPDKVQAMYMGAGGVVALASVGLAVFISQRMYMPALSIIVPVVLAALPFFIFGYLMPTRTVKGARTLEEILGFQEFLRRVEEDRFRRMITGPEMFEAFLPFAMALGVEKKWADAFRDLLTEPPEWYVGHPGGMFRTHLFVSSLGDMTRASQTAMYSQPRSSGGSAFSGGGGFSGGGFGGGGGGGF